MTLVAIILTGNANIQSTLQNYFKFSTFSLVLGSIWAFPAGIVVMQPENKFGSLLTPLVLCSCKL